MGRFLKFMTEQESVTGEMVPTHKDAMVDGMSLLKFIAAAVDQNIIDSSIVIPLDPDLKDDFLKYLIAIGHPLAYKTIDAKTWEEFIKDSAIKKTDSSVGFSSFASNPYAIQTQQWNQTHP